MIDIYNVAKYVLELAFWTIFFYTFLFIIKLILFRKLRSPNSYYTKLYKESIEWMRKHESK